MRNDLLHGLELPGGREDERHLQEVRVGLEEVHEGSVPEPDVEDRDVDLARVQGIPAVVSIATSSKDEIAIPSMVLMPRSSSTTRTRR